MKILALVISILLLSAPTFAGEKTSYQKTEILIASLLGQNDSQPNVAQQSLKGVQVVDMSDCQDQCYANRNGCLSNGISSTQTCDAGYDNCINSCEAKWGGG